MQRPSNHPPPYVALGAGEAELGPIEQAAADSGLYPRIIEGRPVRAAEWRRVTVPGVPASRCEVVEVLRDVCRGAVVAFDIADMADAEVFTGELISAVGEAFNNVVLHAYRGDSSVVVELEVMYDDSGVHAALRDYGPSFDPTRGAATSSFAGADFADNDSLPESGMGLFIMRSFLDEMRYSARQAPGEANVLRMHKRIPGSEGRSSSAVRPRSA